MLDDPVSNSSCLTDSLPLEDSTQQDDTETGSSIAETMVSEQSSQNASNPVLGESIWDPNASSTSESFSAEGPLDHDKYGTLVNRKSSESTFSSTIRKKNRCLRTPTLPVSTIRLSSFGIEKSCPVPKDEIYASPSTASEIYSSGSNNLEDIYGWISGTSQDQEPFSSRVESTTSDDTIENSVDSSCHVKQSLMIRRSRGNPSYAKKVNIPIVPHLPKVPDSETCHLNRLNRNSTNPPVSPHRINNFVYESSPNRFIFDFGDPLADKVDSISSCSEKPSIMTTSTTSLNPYQNALVAKMKETKLNFQRTISGTMTRRKKHKSGSATLPASNHHSSGPHTSLTFSTTNLTRKTSSLLSIERESLPTIDVSHLKVSTNDPVSERVQGTEVIKHQVTHPPTRPTAAPPAPNITRPTVAPPPPPSVNVKQSNHIMITSDMAVTKITSPISSQEPRISSSISSQEPKFSSSISSHEPKFSSSSQEPKTSSSISSQEPGLDEFKIDLKTYTESIPKTGFDFLDNW